MVLLAIFTGMIIFGVWAKQTKWYEILVLCGWGLLAANTKLGAPLGNGLAELNSTMMGWFS